MTENKRLWSKTRKEHYQEYIETKRKIKEIYNFFGWSDIK